MHRTLLAALAVVTFVAAPAPEAAATEYSLLTGIGPRFDVDSGEVNAVTVLHFDYEVVTMFRLSTELYGYAGGPGIPDGIAFADAQIGALFEVPIPGWFGIEAGIHLGLSNLIQGRHGDSGIIGMLRPELAFTATAGFFKARLSYQHNLLPLGATKGVSLADGQATIMAGVTF